MIDTYNWPTLQSETLSLVWAQPQQIPHQEHNLSQLTRPTTVRDHKHVQVFRWNSSPRSVWTEGNGRANRHFLQINMSNNVIANKTLENKIYPGTQTQIHFHLIGTCYRYASIIWQVHTLCNISPCRYSGTIASAFLIWAQTTRRTLSFLMPSTRLFLHTLWSLPCKQRIIVFTFSSQNC